MIPRMPRGVAGSTITRTVTWAVVWLRTVVDDCRFWSTVSGMVEGATPKRYRPNMVAQAKRVALGYGHLSPTR